MTGVLDTWRLPVIAALAAFASALVVLAVAGGGGSVSSSDATVARDPGVVAPGAPATERVRALQASLRGRPSAGGFTALAAAQLQVARETGDAGAFGRAQQAVDRALELEPRSAPALVEASSLAAARHEFPQALALARRARAAEPELLRSYGVLVDALVETGRLGEASRELQAWVDRQPTSAGYARVSYLRELRGDLPGAVTAMELAAGGPEGTAEQSAALTALLGDVQLRAGRLGAAARSYAEALARFPELAKAEIGLARLDATRGRLGAAERRLAALVARLPTPEAVIVLGETQLAAGRKAAASETFALVDAQRRLLEAQGGVRTDAELAIFEADHGRAATAVAMARRGVAAGEGLRAPDALAWALTRAGRSGEGLPWSRRALARTPADPLALFHAGIAARDAGRPALARRWLQASTVAGGEAVLGPWRAAQARRALGAL